MRTRILKFSIALVMFLMLFYVLTFFAPGGDWEAAFRPSVHSLFAGNNPYDNPYFLSPPWVFIILFLPALLPPVYGSALFALVGAVGYLLAIYRLKARPPAVVFLVANPAFLAALFNPNFDWAVALGYTLPPQVGLFFVLTKPQISAPLVIYWLIEAWKSGGYRKVIQVFSPVTVAYGLSVLLFGPWMLNMKSAISSLSNTANVWPWGLLAGVVLIFVALRQHKKNLALMAGPFFSPYLAPYSWLPSIVGLLPSTVETVLACVAFWVAWLISTGIIG